MINLNQLRVFYEAARSGSFTSAARKLFITQPAVTAQMKALEDQCTLKLFKKKGRRLFLTDEGNTLYEYAKRIFEYEREVEDVIEEMRKLKRGILRLGTSKAYARYFMPFLISRFREAYPHIKVYLDEGSSLDIIRSLVDLKNEVAVIAKVEDHPNVTFIPFKQDQLVLILAPGHPLAKRKHVSLEELVNDPMIMKEANSGTRKRVNELFSSKGLTPNVLMETSNTEFIKQLVQRGEGISFLVEEAVAADIREKRLATIPVAGETPFLDVSIAYLEAQHLSHAAGAFVEMLKKVATRGPREQGIRKVMTDYLANWRGPKH
ncbi:MAG: LysR family transcriptional regulator [Deltaproteobacteria bacterium]|nr:LysR family transcriptional regulator [Deltaproteobacteria bacterium]